MGKPFDPSFKTYCQRVIENGRALAGAMTNRGYKIISGGTDNHLMLIDLRSRDAELTGKVAENALVKADITINKNMVPFDSRSPMVTSGIRLGTPALTTRGLGTAEMDIIAGLIDKVLMNPESEAVIGTVKAEVNELMNQYPMFRW